MSRPRLLARRAASAGGVEKPTIVCSGLGQYFYVRLPGEARPVTCHGLAPLPLTWDEALHEVVSYYRKGSVTIQSRNVFDWLGA